MPENLKLYGPSGVRRYVIRAPIWRRSPRKARDDPVRRAQPRGSRAAKPHKENCREHMHEVTNDNNAKAIRRRECVPDYSATMSSDDEDGYRVNAFKGNTSGDSESSDMDSDDDMLLSRRKTQSKKRHHRLWNLLHFSSLFFLLNS